MEAVFPDLRKIYWDEVWYDLKYQVHRKVLEMQAAKDQGRMADSHPPSAVDGCVWNLIKEENSEEADFNKNSNENGILVQVKIEPHAEITDQTSTCTRSNQKLSEDGSSFTEDAANVYSTDSANMKQGPQNMETVINSVETHPDVNKQNNDVPAPLEELNKELNSDVFITDAEGWKKVWLKMKNNVIKKVAAFKKSVEQGNCPPDAEMPLKPLEKRVWDLIKDDPALELYEQDNTSEGNENSYEAAESSTRQSTRTSPRGRKRRHSSSEQNERREPPAKRQTSRDRGDGDGFGLEDSHTAAQLLEQERRMTDNANRLADEVRAYIAQMEQLQDAYANNRAQREQLQDAYTNNRAQMEQLQDVFTNIIARMEEQLFNTDVLIDKFREE